MGLHLPRAAEGHRDGARERGAERAPVRHGQVHRGAGPGLPVRAPDGRAHQDAGQGPHRPLRQGQQAPREAEG